MTRLLHTADLHAGATMGGGADGQVFAREEDEVRTYASLLLAAEEHDVDGVLLTGDSFDKRAPGPAELNRYLAFTRELARRGRRQFKSPGNHDGSGTLKDIMTKTSGWMVDLDIPGFYPMPQPTVLELNDVVIVSVPYPHKRAFDVDQADRTPQERTELVSREYESMLSNFGDSAGAKAAGRPVILMAHVSVHGGHLGSEQQMMQMGWDVVIGPHSLAGFDYAALGHLHPQQRVNDRAWYAGSPQYLSFKEEAQVKGFLLVEVEAGQLPKVTTLTSDPRMMLTIDLGGGHSFATDFDVPQGSIVRLRIHPDADPRQVKTVHDLALSRAAFVRKDDIRPERSARARVDMKPDAGVIENTAEWLNANGYTEDRYLARARTLLAMRRPE